MRQANRVDVVQFHEFEILPHNLFRHVVTCFWVCFVDVDSLELDGLTIHQKQAVSTLSRLYSFNFETTETDRVGDHFPCIIPFANNRNQQFIQVGLLRHPGSHIGQGGIETDRTLAVALHAHLFPA